MITGDRVVYGDRCGTVIVEIDDSVVYVVFDDGGDIEVGKYALDAIH